MAPFRLKQKKWDGNDDNGRYINKNGFKFDVVTKSVVDIAEEMPKYFLADTKEEADRVYKKHEKLLNGFAYTYSLATGIKRSDLFGEALIGLARASRDWDKTRSDNFNTFAIYKIKDALNEFVRKNSAIISVPAYIKKANSNLCEIKAICEANNIDWQTVVFEQETPKIIKKHDIERCKTLIENIINAACRAKTDYHQFVDRISFIPKNISFSDQEILETHERTQEQIDAALIVKKIKLIMDEDELKICDGIMKDKSYEQIASELGTNKAWVCGKLKALRQKLTKSI